MSCLTRKAFVSCKALAWIAGVSVGLTVGSSAFGANLSLDDFESYDTSGGDVLIGQVPGDGRPWTRFGAATTDNVYATSTPGRVISGNKSGHYSVGWPATFGTARRQFAAPLDLTGYQSASITIFSEAAGTTTEMLLVFSDGTATFESKEAFALTDTATTHSFDLQESAFDLVDGSGSFASALAAVQTIGFTLRGGTSAGETVVFDDFTAVIPLPASGLLLIGGAAATLRGRRRSNRQGC